MFAFREDCKKSSSSIGCCGGHAGLPSKLGCSFGGHCRNIEVHPVHASTTGPFGYASLYDDDSNFVRPVMRPALAFRYACLAKRVHTSGSLVLLRNLYRGSSFYTSETPYRKPGMTIKSFPACFVRGGTSNGLMIHRKDLPQDETEWQPILSAAMGSPDSFGRQLDGMGSGISSTSKICVVERSHRAEADLDYTFIQVGIKDGSLDLAGNCGNMSSAVGPFGFSEGLLHNIYEKIDESSEDDHQVNVRIFNTNTSKLINATFSVTKDGVYDPFGDYSIDGVPGSGSRITLSFLDPAGAKTGKALPTGNAVDTITYANGESIRASLVDVANPGVFVLASDLGIGGEISPAGLEANSELMARLERIRQEGARMMGLDPEIQSVPKIVIVSKPSNEAAASGIHIVCRALSMQQPHKAAPLTLALNLGAACRLPETLPATTAVNAEGKESVTVAHASGKVEVGSVFRDWKIESALLHRTARILMKGDVFYTTKT